jgi:hypothetical protein
MRGIIITTSILVNKCRVRDADTGQTVKVRDAKSGTFVTVRGAGALKDSSFKIKRASI